jgi:hypothetical protein
MIGRVRWVMGALHTMKRSYLFVKVALPRPQSWGFGIHTSKYRASSPLHRLNVCISIVRSFKGAAPLMNFDTAGDHVHSIKGGSVILP